MSVEQFHVGNAPQAMPEDETPAGLEALAARRAAIKVPKGQQPLTEEETQEAPAAPVAEEPRASRKDQIAPEKR